MAKDSIAAESHQPPLLSVVIPVKDEADGLDRLFDALMPVLDGITDDVELLFINDGSDDRTVEMLAARRADDPRIRILDLSRNFGKEAALTAGLHHATGQAVVTMDADLQDPPDLIAEMVAAWREGAEMVTARRTSRSTDSFMKRFTANGFYRLFNRISDTQLPTNAGDYRLFDRAVVEAFRQLGERTRFNKGLFAWLGFRQTFVYHERPPGTRDESRWKPLKLITFAVDGILSFSTLPVRLFTIGGLIVAVLALGFALWIVLATLLFGRDVPGYASMMVSILLIGGINMFGIGLLGEYVGRTFTETKQRPLYLVRRDIGGPDE
ncbi:glycosyltransferase family 2 protein [Minwuia sp.]|uniref:glycosyltransferase family 2 protein n=1 Tax=Minwuia sp. TaxID=2493630 RepID=UPI003A9353F1